MAEANAESLGEVFCPFCSTKLKGLSNGIRDKCPVDDCGKEFSIRKY